MITLKLAIEREGTWIEKDIWEIFDPSVNWSEMPLQERINTALQRRMLPVSYKVTCETYCKNADRTANYELEKITNINYKSKPEFHWEKMPIEYLENLLNFLNFRTNYFVDGNFITEEAPIIKVTFRDIVGIRTINAYLGQSIDVELVEYDNVQYYDQVRLAFPER